MERRTLFEAWRVDSVGNGNGCGWHAVAGDHCVCAALE